MTDKVLRALWVAIATLTLYNEANNAGLIERLGWKKKNPLKSKGRRKEKIAFNNPTKKKFYEEEKR